MSAAVEVPREEEGPAGPRFPGRIPGEPGLWVFILGDMVVFGLFFGIIVTFRGQYPEDFLAGQGNLHQTYGMFNALVLLTSSLLVVNGVRLARLRHPRAWQLFAGAIACGAIFAGVKAIEYTTLVQDGHTAGANDFYMYYFVFTAIHLVHVVLGMGALAFAIKLASPVNTGKHREAGIEGVASFWHLVDLLWIMLFALLYLVR